MQNTPEISKVTLAVGIPTFNRPEALCRRIAEVGSFGDLIDELVICDNSDDTSSLVQSALDKVITLCNYNKNINNIGGGANFIRVVENAKTDYLWWRGDDDVITPGQVEAVISCLTVKPRLIFLSLTEKEIYVGNGINDFVNNFDKVQTMGWISSIILPTEISQKALAWGYFGVASGWANVALVLSLFRVSAGLEFVVVPITIRDGDFRDLGRGALDWALFNTCFKNFPLTASVIATHELRRRYLENWRKTHQFRWISTMVRFKLGYMRREEITFTTFSSLLSFVNPKSTLIAVTLYLMAKLPILIYQVLFSIYWLNISITKKKTLGVDFLLPFNKFSLIFKTLRSSKVEESAEVFL